MELSLPLNQACMTVSAHSLACFAISLQLLGRVMYQVKVVLYYNSELLLDTDE